MELTASMMLQTPVNDLMQTSKMKKFHSSESISSASWHHGMISSHSDENSPISDDLLQLNNAQLDKCVDTITSEIKVDLLPEKYGFLKKHVKYLIQGPVRYGIEF